MPDRIETGTYAFAVAMTGGDVFLEGASPAILERPLEVLADIGAEITAGNRGIRIKRNGQGLAPVDVTTEPFPGFPHRSAGAADGAGLNADGSSHIRETNLRKPVHARPGAGAAWCRYSPRRSGRDRSWRAAPEGSGSDGRPDLRASVSLIIAGLAAEGETVVNRVYHLDRGFERIEQKLGACGAAIERLSS